MVNLLSSPPPFPHTYPPPHLEADQARLAVLSTGGASAASKFDALKNLADPLAVAREGGAAKGLPQWPQLPWTPPPGATPRPIGSPGSSGQASPARVGAEGSVDAAAGGGGPLSSIDLGELVGAALRSVNGSNGNGGNGNGGDATGSSRGAPVAAGPRPPEGSGSGSPCSGGRSGRHESSGGASSLGGGRQDSDPVLPLSKVETQMRRMHARGGAGGGQDSEALLQDVIGASMKQVLQQAQRAQRKREDAAAARQAAWEAAAAAGERPQAAEARRDRRREWWRAREQQRGGGAAAASAGEGPMPGSASSNGMHTPGTNGASLPSSNGVQPDQASDGTSGAA